MIVSSVYSWLKDLRANFDIYEEKIGTKKKTGRRCSCNQSYNHEEMFDISEIEGVLLRNDYGRRSCPVRKNYYGGMKKDRHCAGSFAELCIQERAKKAWSVGDAWGVDFQLTKADNTDGELSRYKRRDSEMTDDTVKAALGEFSFLSDDDNVLEDSVDDSDTKEEAIYVNIGTLKSTPLKTPPPDQSEPIYQNIATIGNPRLQELYQRDSTLSNTSLSPSSTYSYVSCGQSESDISPSESSGTYTLNSLYSSFSTSGSTFQTETDSYSILDEDDWKREEWRSLCSLNSATKQGERNPLKPLKKGKSLDSFNPTNNSDGVQLRPKDNLNRRSVIPVLDGYNARKAIILPKDDQSTYMNIWECYSRPDEPKRKKPVPTPRTKLPSNDQKPSTPPKPLSRTRCGPLDRKLLEIKQARENIVSFAFDETVELLPVKEEDAQDVKDDSKFPPLDVLLWMRRLAQECDWEPEVDFETPGHEMDKLMKQKGSPNSPKNDIMIANVSPKGSEANKEDKFKFDNKKKYKMDNQKVKLKEDEAIRVEGGKLLHSTCDGSRILVKNLDECTIEENGSKGFIVITPDKKKINFYSKKDSPESPRMTTVKSEKRNRLMQFFKFRPDKNDLTRKGILQNETFFGNTLKALHEQGHGPTVPDLVRKCIQMVELPVNLETQGLYRSSASLAILQELRFAINKTNGKDLSSLDKYDKSSDVPSGLLKLFIRELKEPLIGKMEFKSMSAICGCEDSEEAKYEAIMKIVEEMHVTHKDTLEVLLTHLIKVESFKDKNDMSLEGISICWGQSMITDEVGWDPVLLARSKNSVVELLLKAYKNKISDGKSTRNQNHCQRQSSTEENKEQEEVTKEQISAKETKVIKDIKPEGPRHSKATRIPQRQASVEHSMKPKVTNATTDSTICKTMNAQSVQRESERKSSSSLSTGSGNRVQEIANKLNTEMTFGIPPRLDQPKLFHASDKMGSTMSLCYNIRSKRLDFVNELIRRIESMPDIKGLYCGLGRSAVVGILTKKYKKEKSKEFGKYLMKATLFDYGQTLQEVVREVGRRIEFDDMELLLENKRKREMRHIFEEIPEEFTLVFRHLDNLRKRSQFDDISRETFNSDIFSAWWDILVGQPDDDRLDERIGRNAETFKKLIGIITDMTNYQMEVIKKAISLDDLRQIEDRDGVCCFGSSGNVNRESHCYSMTVNMSQ